MMEQITGRITLHSGDCLDVLRTLPDASVDSVVTDPPYGLEFMGKDWDKFDKPTKGRADLTDHTNFTPKKSKFKNGVGTQVGMPKKNPRCRVCSRLKFDKPASKCSCQSPDWDTRTRENAQAFGDWCEAWATECLRVLKPGGHLLAFGGTRTWHRLACAVEDAGFEVRDSIAWLYGSGFPKSLDVSKAIDKAAGVLEHEGRGFTVAGRTDKNLPNPVVKGYVPPAPATPDAERWQGWGTALKPSFEGIVCATKPVPALARIGSRLDELEQSCIPPASGAVPSSAPTHPDSLGARAASAPASAAIRREAAPARTTPTGAAGGSSAATATSASELTGATFWNTVTSWKACWAELCEATSTSTTGTTSSTTTDLETLWSCLSQITPESTTTDPTSPDGLSSLVGAVDAMFAAAVLNSRATRTLTAIGSATSGTPPTSPAAGGSRAAFEPVVVARKPIQGTVAANVLAFGTGALNIDGCRVGDNAGWAYPNGRGGQGWHGRESLGANLDKPMAATAGRWPANVVLDESQAVAIDEQSGDTTRYFQAPRQGDGKSIDGSVFGQHAGDGIGYNDTGGASRYFYVAKADASERPRVNGTAHPTVKPLSLMRWLVRLVTPPGGTVLEPFAGSGTTVEACIVEGFQCIAIEREADYLPLIRQRIDRRRDPVEALRGQAADLGLFDLLGGEGA